VPEELVRLEGRANLGSRRDRMTSPAPVGASGGRPGAGPGSGAERLGLRVGDDVAHDKFGEGVIIDLEGEGDKAEAVVRFREAGERRLLLAWAPLRRLSLPQV